MSVDSEQDLDFSKYTGSHWHTGYHSHVVEVWGRQLFIDANHRSMMFTLAFDHVCDGTQLVGPLYDF